VESTLRRQYREGIQRGLHLSPGARGVVNAASLSGTEATGGWLHSYDAEGRKLGATYWRAPTQDLPDDTIDRIRAAFEGMAPAPPVPQPERVMADLCNVFPMFDVHWGMLAWGRETNGQDYDLELAASDLNQAVESVVGMVPFAKQAVIIIGGDFFHVDDSSNETPKSRHKQDTAAKYQKIVATAIDSLKLAVARIQSRHERTLIRVIRGNHDEHSHTVLTFALAERYRNDSTVTVERNPSELFMFQWGRSAIFAHHGDKAPPERQALYLSDICPFWSETRHRHYYTGHIHKDVARDVGPLRWESLRAFCPPDSYAAGMGYASRRALRADTYHVRNGRVLTAHDPIERG
jgi:hypothetical protein